MKSLVALLVLGISLSTFPVESMKSYRNHKVVTFRIENEEQLKEIQSIELQAGVRISLSKVDVL